MAKIIVLSVPSHSHINPTLPIVAELKKRGHTVVYFGTEDFRKKVEATGVSYRAYPITKPPKINIAGNIVEGADYIVDITTLAIPKLLPFLEKEKPDLILADALALWGKFHGHLLHIPVVSYVSTFAFNTKIILSNRMFLLTILSHALTRPFHYLRAQINYFRLAYRYGLPLNLVGDIFTPKDPSIIKIVLTTSAFQPLSETFDASYHFVGPMLTLPKAQKGTIQIPKGKKVIYISLGSIYTNNLTFFKSAIEAFRGSDYTIVISIGSKIKREDLGEVPSNILLFEFVPQLEVLSKTDLFITHGGFNSTSESIYYGVPMLVVPQIFEQKYNAERIERLGIGIYMQQLDAASIRAAAEKVLGDSSYKERITKLQKSFQTAGGAKAAAQIIEEQI